MYFISIIILLSFSAMLNCDNETNFEKFEKEIRRFMKMSDNCAKKLQILVSINGTENCRKSYQFAFLKMFKKVVF